MPASRASVICAVPLTRNERVAWPDSIRAALCPLCIYTTTTTKSERAALTRRCDKERKRNDVALCGCVSALRRRWYGYDSVRARCIALSVESMGGWAVPRGTARFAFISRELFLEYTYSPSCRAPRRVVPHRPVYSCPLFNAVLDSFTLRPVSPFVATPPRCRARLCASTWYILSFFVYAVY